MMHGHKIMRDLYRDSVSLMQISARVAELPGVHQASAVMATPANIELLVEAGLIEEEGEAGANDLLIVAEADDEAAIAAAMDAFEASLAEEPVSATGDGGDGCTPPRSIEMALGQTPGANLALIATPGEYAAAEAEKALRLGLNVMLFSDNVALKDEIALKAFATVHNLMVMGPDCGTAIIDGIPLGFANAVRRGDIGVVAASGTGLQQVTCLVDRGGCGISQAIGTGGRDLHADVGGVTMLRGLEALASDPETKVIVLVSKPPAARVATRILDRAATAGKPAVVCFLGADPQSVARDGIHAAETLEDAANMAVTITQDQPDSAARREIATSRANSAAHPFAKGQRFLRGLYSGGTLCYEAQLILREKIGLVRSSTPLSPEGVLDDPWTSREHTVIDLGDDVFTRGRPHPMIDHRLRNERIMTEAADPEVAVILFDAVLGYGTHMDPAGIMAPVIREAREMAEGAGRVLTFVGSVCGTEQDLQGFVHQESALSEAGAVMAESNAAAVRLAGRLVESANKPENENVSR